MLASVGDTQRVGYRLEVLGIEACNVQQMTTRVTPR